MENKISNRERYITLIKDCLDAWNRADVEAVASFYSDDLDYRDPSVPLGIKNKTEFVKYLKLLFKIWPSQSWILDKVYSHTTEGSFNVDYTFRFANEKTSIIGKGIDLIIFKDDKVCVNHVYLNAAKWNDWITNELKGK
jgi:hypothetical protein